jgi:hypothetical protein
VDVRIDRRIPSARGLSLEVGPPGTFAGLRPNLLLVEQRGRRGTDRTERALHRRKADLISRILTVKAPQETFDRSHGLTAATLVKSFQRMSGFLGGVVLVEVDGSCVRTIGFWENQEAVAASASRARSMGANLASTLLGDKGTYDVQTFEVIAIDPPPAVPFPES